MSSPNSPDGAGTGPHPDAAGLSWNAYRLQDGMQAAHPAELPRATLEEPYWAHAAFVKLVARDSQQPEGEALRDVEIVRGDVPPHVLATLHEQLKSDSEPAASEAVMVQYCEVLDDLTVTRLGDVPHSDARHNGVLRFGDELLAGLHQGPGGVTTLAEFAAVVRENTARVLRTLDQLSDAGWGLSDIDGGATAVAGFCRLGYPGPQATVRS